MIVAGRDAVQQAVDKVMYSYMVSLHAAYLRECLSTAAQLFFHVTITADL